MIKSTFRLLSLCLISFLYCSTLCAQPPIIRYNVHVMVNTRSSMCFSTYRGTSSPDSSVVISGNGMGNTVTPGIRSCIGCSFDDNTKDCVCRTCYDYY